MANDKFIWQKGDVKLVDESSFKNGAKLYSVDESKPYKCCALTSVCVECDEEDQSVAISLAQKVYDSFFATSESDEVLLQKVMKSYVALCKKVLPADIVLTKQLFCCAKMKLLDLLIKNGKFSEQQIKRNL